MAIRKVGRGDALSATHYNKLVEVSNLVTTMTGNVIHSPDNIHIPKRLNTLDQAITYREVPAFGPDGYIFSVGTVVRIVRAYPPEHQMELFDGWQAYVVPVAAYEESLNANGHVGYAIVTEEINPDDLGMGAVAISGQVPAIVVQPTGTVTSTTLAAGVRTAHIDMITAKDNYINYSVGGGTNYTDYLQISGSSSMSTMDSTLTFRLLHEDPLAGDIPVIPPLVQPTPDFSEPHWGLVEIEFGKELRNAFSIKNEYDTDPIYVGQPVEITGEEDGYLVVDRPSENSVPASRVLFPVGVLGKQSDSPYGNGTTGAEGVWVTYSGADPSIGSDMGTVLDSFEFATGNDGFVCIAVDTTEKRALIRPKSAGGGVTLAKAVTIPINGSVDVKYIRYIDGVPNYETYGADVTCVYPYSG